MHLRRRANTGQPSLCVLSYVRQRVSRLSTIQSMNVTKSITPVLVLMMCSSAYAADYALSSDGASVVRLTPRANIAASTFNQSLLPSGWTSTAGSGGSLSVTSYDAGYQGGVGGGKFTALYNRGSNLAPGQSLEWVQVINSNVAIAGESYPTLDNLQFSNGPFYDFTAANRDPSLPANQLNFYDFSTRSPASLSTTNPITWDANLYPVIRDSTNAISVFDGVNWGWTMKKATAGTTSAVFTNPAPGSAVTTGVGTNTFSWGTGEQSQLSFAGRSFDTVPNTPFVLGTLSYHNGTIVGTSGADSVDFTTSINFANVPEKNFDISSRFLINNTTNTADPIASADSVSLGRWPFIFNVLEGASASVNILARFTTTLSGSPSGTNAAPFSDDPFDLSPNYELEIIGLIDPSEGGFVTGAVPEPSTYGLVAAFALAGLAYFRKRRQS